MSKHTPGPWHIDGNPDDGRIVTEFVSDRIEVWTGGERTAHDVRLIAAAPELLAACKAAVQMADGANPDHQAIYDQLNAAITKAEGKE